MKNKTKMSLLAFGCIVCAALSAVSMAGAVLVITGNFLNFDPVAKPTVQIVSNSTSTPYVGDTIHFVATLSVQTANIPVTLNINSVPLLTVNSNTQGVSTFDYKVLDTTHITAYPTASFP